MTDGNFGVFNFRIFVLSESFFVQNIPLSEGFFVKSFYFWLFWKEGEKRSGKIKRINRIPLKNFFNILELTQNIAKMWLSCLPERFFAKKIYLNGFIFNVVTLSIFLIFMQSSKISVSRICDYKTFRVHCFEEPLEEKLNELSLRIV